MPKQTLLPDLDAIEDGDKVLIAEKWMRRRPPGARSIPIDDVKWLTFAAVYPPAVLFFNVFGDSRIKMGRRRSSRLEAIFTRHPDEAAALWSWARAEARRVRKTKLHRARQAVRYVRMTHEQEGRSWKAQTVEAYLCERYGRQDWSSAVEDAIRAERVSGKTAAEKPD